MAKEAMYRRKDGTEAIVNAKTAFAMGSDEKFYCIGHNENGDECGCELHCTYRKLENGEKSHYFYGKHIAHCDQASNQKVVRRPHLEIEHFNFEDFFALVEEEPANNPGGDGPIVPPGGGGIAPPDEDDFGIEHQDQAVAPKGVKDLYTLLKEMLPDERVAGRTVAETLICEDNIALGLCRRIEEYKVIVVERCLCPKTIDKDDNEIVVRVCDTMGENVKYLILRVESNYVRYKVWKTIRPFKEDEDRHLNPDRLIVAGDFVYVNEKVSMCKILHSRMVARCPD